MFPLFTLPDGSCQKTACCCICRHNHCCCLMLGHCGRCHCRCCCFCCFARRACVRAHKLALQVQRQFWHCLLRDKVSFRDLQVSLMSLFKSLGARLPGPL